MKCPNCGNEISPEESFCGQCGTPNIPPARSTGILNTPSSRSGLLSGTYNTQLAPTQGSYNSGMLPPPDIYNTGRSSPPGSPSPHEQPMPGPSGPQQQNGFYHDATESMSPVQINNSQNYQPGYPPQSFTATPTPTVYPGTGQYGPPMQPFSTRNYAGPTSPQSQPFYSGQGYGMPPGLTPPPKKQRSNLVLVIACICLVFAIISVAAFGALYLLRGNSSPKTHHKTASAPTTEATATSVPSPTPGSSPSPTVTNTPSPTPSLSPTITSDQGFTWCSSTCTSYGFMVEYPNGWQQGITQDPNGFGGVQFSNSSTNKPSVQDEIADFKSAVSSAHSESELINADLSANFASLPGYTAPTTSPANAWIGGAKWLNQTASYSLNNQPEHLEVFATLYQGKAYIIELQAPQSAFDGANNQYFERMLGRFQFQ